MNSIYYVLVYKGTDDLVLFQQYPDRQAARNELDTYPRPIRTKAEVREVADGRTLESFVE